ncbi:DUF2316 family protein [Bifidobacterium saguinibicoloris]|uniref:DUF2316 family protein n=1 Tax=Bifidobacterium saguinibicoloris TaxID=2834433 RepID=UPI001C5778BF|nr:DUF2316 family protein [Bifidobacterium saguinibicoloris]MBW3079948.1 DUF2316 family protein [Bifidobacterium saguinibicoloris]
MSLTTAQREATIREFHENLRRLNLTAGEVAEHFGVDASRIETIIDLESGVLEYPWIVRGYLLDEAAARCVTLTPFTALRGDPHDYWFLDGTMIDRGVIS